MQLTKHHGMSFFSMPLSNMSSAATTLQHEERKHVALSEGVFTRAEQKVANPLIDTPESYLEATPTFKQPYAQLSGNLWLSQATFPSHRRKRWEAKYLMES